MDLTIFIFFINICMSTDYTNYTVNKIMSSDLIDTEKLCVMDVEDFMHPELYKQVMEELATFNRWGTPEIQGRVNYFLGPDVQHPTALQIARDSVWKNTLVNDAIQTRFNFDADINIGEPLMWRDNNTNQISDVHVDSPAYYYTYQHCLATDDEFAHTGTKFWEVDCSYDEAIDEGLDPTFGEDSKVVNLGHQMPYVPNRAYILPRSSRGWHSCPDLTVEADHMVRTMVYTIVTKQT
ncbi:hypothetical protein N9H30_00870 [bacterium]|nr:hypothetical protein [bacterium]